MTPAELTDLRDWLATEVMGWTFIPEHNEDVGEYGVIHHLNAHWKKKGELIYFDGEWRPNDPKTGQVWLLVERMRELGWRLMLTYPSLNEPNKIAAEFHYKQQGSVASYIRNPNPCLAICLAARAAMEATRKPEQPPRPI